MRFKERDRKGKGRMEDLYDIPERLEGRRRMRIVIDRQDGQSWIFSPMVGTGDDDDLNAFLTKAQQELFEEELFGQVNTML